jgi:hypothetical protein
VCNASAVSLLEFESPLTAHENCLLIAVAGKAGRKGKVGSEKEFLLGRGGPDSVLSTGLLASRI